jgi:hypothetical protein
MLCGSTLNFKGAKEAQNIHDVYNKTAPHGIPLLLMMGGKPTIITVATNTAGIGSLQKKKFPI